MGLAEKLTRDKFVNTSHHGAQFGFKEQREQKPRRPQR